mmetsp:Transcript_29065/g.55105  ORF Transcript_29065/g.55105 Transcript_29065/m.55105 type:complete len:299 (+) Transcript_29065:728-1624(+)
MLPKDDASTRLRFTAHEADGFRRHNLVRRFVLDHAILVNAALVLEGVGSHDGLVRLTFHARVFRNHFGGGGDVNGIDSRVELARSWPPRKVRSSLERQRHDNLLQAGVSRPFADAVDGALQLPRAVQRPREAVCGGQSQIVLTVGAEHNVLGAGDVLAQFLDQLSELPGHVPSRRVGDVQRGRSRHDDLAKNSIEKFRIGSTRVLGTEFDIVASQTLREGDSLHCNFYDFVGSLIQLALHVNVAGGNERVNPRPESSLHGIPRPFDILRVGAAQSRNHRNVPIIENLSSNLVGDLLNA